MSESSNTLPPVTKILWGALTMSQLVYLIVATIIEVDAETKADDTLVMALLIIGISTLAVSIFVIPKVIKVPSKSAVLTPFIIQWALIESVCIYGLAGRFLGAPEAFYYGMICMGIAFMLFLFPTDRRAEDFIKKETD